MVSETALWEASIGLRISVFGLGYVGTVTAGCLAAEGHQVIGIELNPEKLRFVAEGRAPVFEPGADALIRTAVGMGLLSTETNACDAVRATDASFVCVGTPTSRTGRPDYSHVERVCAQIGAALADIDHYHVVNIRSTVLPGTIAGILRPLLEECSGKRADRDFGLTHNPEFLRQGSAIKDFTQPPKIVVGGVDARATAVISSLYRHLPALLIEMSIETAEMVKFTDNAWHALKVVFANEIGSIAKSVGIDGREVMDVFCQDTTLNISKSYLKPGFAFGGSCLPKDTRALVHVARQHDVSVPLIENILISNAQHIDRCLQKIIDCGRRRIGVLGCSFKAETDDLRESPVVELIERLIGKGYDVRVYDRNVRLSALMGANRAFILDRIPHISGLMEEKMEDIVDFADVVVIGTGDPDFGSVGTRFRPDQIVIDLVHTKSAETATGYYGICW